MSTMGTLQYHLFERLKFNFRQPLSAEVAEQLVVKVGELNYFADRLSVDVVASVLGQRVDHQMVTGSRTVSIEVPVSWWDHWKLDHAESRWFGWIARRYQPALRSEIRVMRYEVDIERLRTFPQATVAFPREMGQFVNVLEERSVRWTVGDTDGLSPDGW